jgi:hypothetical protein
VSAEDAANDTIAPRLTAVGADLTCVHILDSVKDASGGERNFSLQTDLKNLEAKIEELGDVVMVIIDPVTAYMGDKIDSNQTTAIRAVLGPVAKLAERTDVCFLVITHPTKAAQANAINMLTGSLAYAAAPRCVFLAMTDPNNKDRSLLLTVKINIGQPAAGLGYRSIPPITLDDGIETVCVEWDAEDVTMTANEALAEERNAGRRSQKLTVAESFLRSELAFDVRRSWSDLVAKATESKTHSGERASISERSQSGRGFRGSRSGICHQTD